VLFSVDIFVVSVDDNVVVDVVNKVEVLVGVLVIKGDDTNFFIVASFSMRKLFYF
jgi:hypothetical protein